MSTGRNDPCPCGSGVKYKKCCLPGEEPDAQELFRLQLENMRTELNKKVIKFSIKIFGPEAIEEAWDEFHLWSNKDSFDPESPDLPLFMSFFFYDWYPDEMETTVQPDAPRDKCLAQVFLETTGRRLNHLEVEHIQACTKVGLSFYEILECWPGKGLKVQDLLTGELYTVVEKMGSRGVKPADLLFGKIVTVSDLSTIEASSMFFISPQYKIDIMDFKKSLKKKGYLDPSEVREFTLEILELYNEIRDELENPRMPTLVNTDGDLLAPHILTYEIDNPEQTIEALAPLSLDQSGQDILSYAEKTSDGQFESVDFPWLKAGNRMHKSWENTILGHITLEKNKLKVEVNSAKRASLFQKKLKALMPSGWRLLSKSVEPIDMNPIREALPYQSTKEKEETDKLNKDPEVLKMIERMNQEHWENWVHLKIPALGNKTPIQAAKSKDGREALDALISQFERDIDHHPVPGQNMQTFARLREQLDL